MTAGSADPQAAAPVDPLASAQQWYAGANNDNLVERPCEIDELLERKGDRSVSVVLPALNEEATVAAVVQSVLPWLGTLVDELLVVDSGSTDQTVKRAREAGAKVVRREDVLPHLPVRDGKGEVLWRSLLATKGDLLAFIDADLRKPNPLCVPTLLTPLLTNSKVHLVKGCYQRALRLDGVNSATGGGRVTELAARPLLAALRPELSYIQQPLSGEYAATRELLESVPFAGQYGVEVGLLLDTYHRYGLEAIAQVNLGHRQHRNRPLEELAVMSRQVIATIFDRCGIEDPRTDFVYFTSPNAEIADSDGTMCEPSDPANVDSTQAQIHAHRAVLTVEDRPPMRSVQKIPKQRYR